MLTEKNTAEHIILVGPVAPPIGGVTQWTSLVTNELLTQQIDQSIVNTSPSRRRLDGQSKMERVSGGLRSTLAAARKLIQRGTAARPSAIHISSSGSIALVRDIVVALIGKTMRARILLHLHHGRLPRIVQQRSFERTAMDILARLVDTMIVLDKTSAQVAAERWKKLSVTVIANPVATQDMPATDSISTQKTVLYLGWVVPNKGVEDLLQVWSDLSVEHPEWHLELVGGVADEYRQYLAEKYQGERWEFAGEMAHREAMERLAAADILVLPSYSEGFPNVILEAMSFGKPVVATDVGGIPEMLSQGEGLLVKPRAHDQLHAALARLMGDDAFRAATGRKGYQRVETEYAVSRVVQNYRRLWEGKTS